MHDFKQLIASFESSIRAGRLQEVRAQLGAKKSWKVPREHLADFANIARRSGLMNFSLRLLRPVVDPEKLFSQEAAPREKAIYAAALAAIGAFREASMIIQPIAADSSPEVQLYSGFVHVHRWDYAAAAKFYANYLELPGTTPYQKLVAQLNLGSCLSFLRESEKLTTLSRTVLDAATENQWALLARDALLLATQANIQLRRWDEARSAIDQGLKLCHAKQLDDLLLRKWDVVLRLHLQGRSRETLSTLRRLREQAVQKKRYEVVRDCDFYEGWLASERHLLQKVFVGTPFPSYRARVEAETRGFVKLPDQYRWHLAAAPGAVSDLGLGKVGTFSLRDNEIALRVLRTLAADFYRPLKMGALFSGIYPDESFDPVSSPARVRQAVTRTRDLLSNSMPALTVQCEKGEYSLAAQDPVDLIVHTHYRTREDDEASRVLKTLKSRYPYKMFSSAEAHRVVELSSTRVKKILEAAERDNKIYAHGENRSKRYRFAK